MGVHVLLSGAGGGGALTLGVLHLTQNLILSRKNEIVIPRWEFVPFSLPKKGIPCRLSLPMRGSTGYADASESSIVVLGLARRSVLVGLRERMPSGLCFG